jgi:hypothetical protein
MPKTAPAAYHCTPPLQSWGNLLFAFFIRSVGCFYSVDLLLMFFAQPVFIVTF